MVLCEAEEALSTTEVRERLNRGRERALVAEQVYRALAALERGGYMRWVDVAGSRKAFWQSAVDVAREEAG
jgi:Fe2+ or Zn2+ uptake regulation protein